jgi:hypothetical protein
LSGTVAACGEWTPRRSSLGFEHDWPVVSVWNAPVGVEVRQPNVETTDGATGTHVESLQRKDPTMAGNAELIMRVHPVSGEDISLLTTEFDSPGGVVDAIARALDERRSLVLARARYDRETTETAVVVNLANVVSVRVARNDSQTTGQYL